jgi:glutathione S-transferase
MSLSIKEARALLLGDGTTRPRLEFFKIESVAEPVRIALSVSGIPFDDVYFDFFSPEWHTNFSPEWHTRKSSAKFGQLPELILPNGTVVTDSLAMLRLAGEADEEGKLYPTNIESRIKVESAIGLVGDMRAAWTTPFIIGMVPERFGYPPKDEWTDKDATVKKLRTAFVENDLPRFMQHFSLLIKENGDQFLTGEHLTIADIAAYQTINYFRRGLADHVPQDCLDKHSAILEWLGRIEGHKKVAAYMESKDKSVKGFV